MSSRCLALLLAAFFVGGCHSHGAHEEEHDGPSTSQINARVTSRVRSGLLEQRLGEGRPSCAAIEWLDDKPVCARDREEMVVVPLRAGETAYYCPTDTLFWYTKSGVWLGPFESGLPPRE